jgi:hypothetical protein
MVLEAEKSKIRQLPVMRTTGCSDSLWKVEGDGFLGKREKGAELHNN